MSSERTDNKYYEQIKNVTTFANDAGPFVRPILLATALTSSELYPRTRIMIAHAHGTICLTTHQAATLRDQLDTAIAEVLKSCPAMAQPDDFDLKDPPRG
jgi:hypothetical protein